MRCRTAGKRASEYEKFTDLCAEGKFKAHCLLSLCKREGCLAGVQSANMKMQSFTNGRYAGILVDMPKEN